jgi:hypothetical protein
VPFYRVRCGAGWPGVGGERAAVVVRHIGGGDGHFGGDRSGCWWGVMRGGGAPVVTGGGTHARTWRL